MNVAAAVPTRREASEPRVLLRSISWDTYDRLLRELDDRGVRLTYDRGELEIMSPSKRHERLKCLLGRLVEQLTLELSIPISSCGSTTWRSRLKQRGLEPDECYYVAHEEWVRDKEEVDLEVDPPPDLAIEVEISPSALDRMTIYAALGIPEVWRYDGETLRVQVLGPDGRYSDTSKSPTFPFLPLDSIEHYLSKSAGKNETQWMREFRDWVRDSLSPGQVGGESQEPSRADGAGPAEDV